MITPKSLHGVAHLPTTGTFPRSIIVHRESAMRTHYALSDTFSPHSGQLIRSIPIPPYRFLNRPRVSAILASADRLVDDFVLCAAGSCLYSLILFLLEWGGKKPQYQTGEKENKPGEKVYDPPPPTNRQPPQKAMPLFFIFGFGLCGGLTALLLLKSLSFHVFRVALWAYHIHLSL